MSNIADFLNKKLIQYEKKLIYYQAKADVIHQLLLISKYEFNDNKNELENFQINKLEKKLRKICKILDFLVRSN